MMKIKGAAGMRGGESERGCVETKMAANFSVGQTLTQHLIKKFYTGTFRGQEGQ